MKRSMKRERKIIVYIATSADGYIARRDGNVDWLNRPRTAGDYGIGAFYRSIDTILWGRKTYDVALGFQKKKVRGSGFDAKIKNYVFSRKPQRGPTPGVEFVKLTGPPSRSGFRPVGAFARRLRATPGKNIWMMGGAELIASFLDAGEVDEFIIHVIPTFIGEGIPLVQPNRRDVALSLKSVKRFKDGVVRLHYAVVRPASRRRKQARK